MAERGVSVPPRIAVVGGGLAGLRAAMVLHRGGAQVELFERTRLLGGKATSFSVDGVEVDNGQHVLLGCCTELLRFIDEVGMRGSLRMQKRFQVSLLTEGHPPGRLRAAPLPAPLHLLPSVAALPLLSLRDKASLGRALLSALRDPAPSGDMAAWLRRNGQSAAARRVFWDPFLVPALNAPLHDVAAADGVFVIRTAFLSGRGAARIGWTTVPLARIAEAAAATLDAVHLRQGVTSLRHDGERATGIALDDTVRDDFDGYVLAIPPHRLLPLIARADPPLAGDLRAFRTQPIVDVHLWYRLSRPLLGDAGFAALLDSPVQWVFEKTPGYLCCSASAATEWMTLSQDELVQRCHQTLAAVLPPLRGRTVMRSAVTRDRDATFVPSPSLRRPGPRTALRNVVVAGAWTDTRWPATMESAVRSGRTAARVLAQQLREDVSQGAVMAEYAHAV